LAGVAAVRLWEWVSIKYGDQRTDEQKAADEALKARQEKALANFKRFKKRRDLKAAPELEVERQSTVVEMKRKVK
jgi:hypothetical protein